jgi:hypothetical protein
MRNHLPRIAALLRAARTFDRPVSTHEDFKNIPLVANGNNGVPRRPLGAIVVIDVVDLRHCYKATPLVV